MAGPDVALVLFVSVIALASPATSLTTDGLALLAFKFAATSDPNNALSTWRDSDASPCSTWTGVTCTGGGRVTVLSLSNFSISGYIPSELSLLTSLSSLSLPRNLLSGPIPSSLAALRSLTLLDLSHNLLSGAIPLSLFPSLSSLSHLDLSSNSFNSSLPPSLASLPNLSGVLNLSYNQFSGPIPPEFGTIPVVVSLDLRFNKLSGEIPQVGSLVNQGPTAFIGNPGLCGFPLRNACPGASSEQDPKIPRQNDGNPFPTVAAAPTMQRRRSSLAIPVLAGVVVVAFASALVLQWQFRRRCAAASDDEKTDDKFPKDGVEDRPETRAGGGEVFVAIDDEFGLELEEMLRASAYVVGKSRTGIVYKVVPCRSLALAVRRLSEGDGGDSDQVGSRDEWRRRRAFESEAMAIGRAMHPNVVRLRAYYYAPDEKLLIYDYIPNGSLHSSLHGGGNSAASPLPWAARLTIIQGAARGLAFLHDGGSSARKNVHGGVRSSKILLDDELRPYVSGFGVSRIVASTQKPSARKLAASPHRRNSPESVAEAYVAPELRCTDGGGSPTTTQKGDVYAFGIVLLEAVTGRHPGAGNGDLEPWVKRAFKEERPLSEIVDPALLHEVHAKKQVLAVLHVALSCTDADPELRPRMRAVADSLDRIV